MTETARLGAEMEDRRTIPAAGLALVLVCLAAAGCASPAQLERWPLLPVEPETDRFPGRLRLGPFADVQWKDSTCQWGVRPLFSVRQYWNVAPDQRLNYDLPYYAPPALLDPTAREGPPPAAPGQTPRRGLQVYALPPFFWHASCGAEGGTQFIPFYYDFRGRNETEGRHHIWGLVPLYFGGYSDQRGSYHALFPLGGTVKNMLGRDRIDFVLFPLFSHARNGEHHSYTVLWPFINWSRGGGRWGWRVWPLVGRSKDEGEPPYWFILWPLFGFSESAGEGDREVHRYGAFPLYLWQKEGAVTTVSILGPIVSYSRNADTGRTEYVAPWPLFRYGYGPEYSRFQLWPFYGQVRERHVRQQYLLWPFFRFQQKDTARSRSRARALFMIYREKSREWQTEDNRELSTYENALWPLWYYRRDELGNAYLGALSLFGAPDVQGWRRLYAPLWDLYEYDRRTYGAPGDRRTWRSHRLLWGAIGYEEDERSSSLRVFPLFSVDRRDGAFTGFHLLAGLFGYADDAGKRTVRLFFIPWTIDTGDDG
ncbi:MAG: hypothetical protein ACOC8E_00770 [Planctomycetota bacterium]